MAAPVFIVLVGLGTWQVERKAWKEDLIATLEARQDEPPVELSSSAGWSVLDPAFDQYRRVRFVAIFDYSKEALVYATASSFRPDVAGTGYWVMTPARLADGSLVLVNRGFVPEARKDAATRSDGNTAGPLAIVGALRWPEQRYWYTPAADVAHNVWFHRDIDAIAAAKGLSGTIAPFYVEQETPVPTGGLPQPGRIAVKLRNAHLGYAITWYGLALALAVVFLSLVIKSRRETQPAGPPSERP